MLDGAHDNMNIKISKQKKRAIFLGAIVALQVIGVVIFNQQGSVIRAFQPYYAKSWIDSVFARDYGNLDESLLASVGEVQGVSFVRNNSDSSENDSKFAKGIPVLVYHGVVNEPSTDGINISYERVKEQMESLKQAGYTAISLEEFDHFMKGKQTLQKKSVLITFDDGRRDSYYPTDSLFATLNFHATIFVITNRLDSNFHLNGKELKKMSDSGRWDIQSHGHLDHDFISIGENGEQGHFMSNLMWIPKESRNENVEEMKSRITSDLISSKNNIDEITNKPVYAYAFPFGDHGKDSLSFSDAGDIVIPITTNQFRYSFFQVENAYEDFFNYPEDVSKTKLVKRFKPLETWTGSDLVNVLEQSMPKDLDYEDSFSKGDLGWVSVLGEKQIVEDQLFLKASENTSGSEIYLGGTKHWKNYVFQAQITEPTTAFVGLVAGYVDENNYYVCSYGENSVQLSEISNGERKSLAFSKATTTPDIAIRFYGGKVGCYVGEDEILMRTVGEKTGGIGIKIWEEQLGNAQTYIDNIFVKNCKEVERCYPNR